MVRSGEFRYDKDVIDIRKSNSLEIILLFFCSVLPNQKARPEQVEPFLSVADRSGFAKTKTSNRAHRDDIEWVFPVGFDLTT